MLYSEDYDEASFLHQAVPPDYPVPARFNNCRADFIPGKDEKYAQCNISNGDDPCYLLRELHRAKEFRTYFLAILPIIFSVFAFILNVIYIILVIRLYRNTGSSHKKRYIFLISRSMSALMALILFYVVIICWKTGGFLYSSAMIFILVGGLNFLSMTGTYIALTCLLYTAVVHPIVYRTKVTLRHCYALVAVIWLISTAASICVGLWGATLFYPETAPIHCSYEKCQRPLAICLVICLSICYSAVLIIYAVLLIRLHMRFKKQTKLSTGSTVDRQRASVVAMNRLGLNMGTFAIGTVPILVVCIVAMANLRSLSSLGEGQKSPCKTYLNSKLFVEVEILASVAALVWLIAMIIDPIINTVGDKKLWTMLKDDFTTIRQRVSSWRANDTETTEVVVDGSVRSNEKF